MSGLEELLTGRTLVKRYRIQEVIGRGGFAAVYRAEDERLGRPVAVKVITIPAPDAAAAKRHRERFEREARAAASLPQHPNVVTVHDFGVDPQLGLDFLVMEFLHGEDLATRLRNVARLPLTEALGILRETVSGIAVGHRAGIVHRDVKPGNIFLARTQGNDATRVCILDFGIARVVADDQTLTRLPGEGTPLSPAYASPEQSRGVTELTPASDVFSLGVVAFQLLAGEKPFAEPRDRDPSDWVPLRRLREINPEVPDWLEAVVMRAMSYAPESRFADADEMAAALASEATAQATPRLAPPAPAATSRGSAYGEETLYQPEPAPPQQQRHDRHRGGASGGASQPGRSGVWPVLLGLLLVGSGAGWWYFRAEETPSAGDPAAAAEIEAIAEDLQDESEPDDRAEPTIAVEELPPIQPRLDTATFDSFPFPAESAAVGGIVAVPADTASADSIASPGAPISDTIFLPADSVLPPPRVIGVPVERESDEPVANGDN